MDFNKLLAFSRAEKPANFFLISFTYSLLLLVIAYFVFTKYVGMLSVFLVSLALLPAVSRYLSHAEKFSGRFRTVEKKDVALQEITLATEKFSFKQFILDFSDVIQVFFYCFLGVFTAYGLVSFLLPVEFVQVSLSDQVSIISGQAFNVLGTPSGMASAQNLSLWNDFTQAILLNNLFVMVICFVLPLLLEFGSTFVVVWNASLWGTVFALHARNVALIQGINPFIVLGSILLIVLPHTFLEAGAYFIASIAGSISHHAIVQEKIFSKRAKQLFFYVFILVLIALAFLVLGAIVETIAKELLVY